MNVGAWKPDSGAMYAVPSLNPRIQARTEASDMSCVVLAGDPASVSPSDASTSSDVSETSALSDETSPEFTSSSWTGSSFELTVSAPSPNNRSAIWSMMALSSSTA